MLASASIVNVVTNAKFLVAVTFVAKFVLYTALVNAVSAGKLIVIDMHVIVYATPVREGLNPITKPNYLVKDLLSPPPKAVASPTIQAFVPEESKIP